MRKAPWSRRWTGSPARMRAGVRLLEASPGDVGVDLSRAEVLMPEELLDRAQVGAAIEEVCRERMPERVRMDGRAGSKARQEAVHVPFEGARRHAHAARSEQDRLARARFPAERLPEAPERRHGPRSDGDDALADSLPQDEDKHAQI